MHCSWHLVYINCSQMMRQPIAALQQKGTPLSKTVAITLAPSNTLFGRFLALLDRLLMKSAEISNRNGDLPPFGL